MRSGLTEEFPGLTQIVHCIAGPGSNENDFYSLPKGCNCISLCEDQQICECLSRSASSVNELVETTKMYPTFECNTDCKCDSSCSNRFSQTGPHEGLKVISLGPKGLGVVTDKPISPGKFVCEYAGEVIGKEEALRRLNILSPHDNNYILVLREHFGQPPRTLTTIVDPTSFGNIGRFINHSCDPNLCVIPLRSRSMIPIPAMFALKTINPGEELTYNYSATSGLPHSLLDENLSPGLSSKLCLCGTSLCRKFLPSDLNI